MILLLSMWVFLGPVLMLTWRWNEFPIDEVSETMLFLQTDLMYRPTVKTYHSVVSKRAAMVVSVDLKGYVRWRTLKLLSWTDTLELSKRVYPKYLTILYVHCTGVGMSCLFIDFMHVFAQWLSFLLDLGSLRVVLFNFCMVIGGVRGLLVFVRCIALRSSKGVLSYEHKWMG